MFIKEEEEGGDGGGSLSDENTSSSDTENNETQQQAITLPEYVPKDNIPSDDDEFTTSLENHSDMAKVYAWGCRANVDDVMTWYRVIDKDIPRTDYSHPYFEQGSDKVISQMRSILATFGFFHPNIGYVQVCAITQFLVANTFQICACQC